MKDCVSIWGQQLVKRLCKFFDDFNFAFCCSVVKYRFHANVVLCLRRLTKCLISFKQNGGIHSLLVAPILLSLNNVTLPRFDMFDRVKIKATSSSKQRDSINPRSELNSPRTNSCLCYYAITATFDLTSMMLGERLLGPHGFFFFFFKSLIITQNNYGKECNKGYGNKIREKLKDILRLLF